MGRKGNSGYCYVGEGQIALESMTSRMWPFDMAFLRRSGLDVPDRDPVERGAMDQIGVFGGRESIDGYVESKTR